MSAYGELPPNSHVQRFQEQQGADPQQFQQQSQQTAAAEEEPVAMSIDPTEAEMLVRLRHVSLPPPLHPLDASQEQIARENEELKMLIGQFQRLQEVQKSRVRVHLTAEFRRTQSLQRQIESLQNDAANLLKERNMLSGKQKSGSGSQPNFVSRASQDV